jgi:hypothetical protein
MLSIDPYMKAGLVSFFIPVLLGCLAYCFATLLAGLISTNSRRRLFRLIVLAVFVIAIFFYCNSPYWVFSGGSERALMHDVREVGSICGTMSLCVWLIFALLKDIRK